MKSLVVIQTTGSLNNSDLLLLVEVLYYLRKIALFVQKSVATSPGAEAYPTPHLNY